ncbi:hypothetical protein Fcan01_19630 [Folsomia candida]|uniref:Uncharacterized protein n=1 Tax=Folsomia candida TaxID=158441 RepID=A0A226DKK6_FOLCA|nr:hypothetical protein Fcan01_19630 [Folsomia candida]
MGQWSSLLLLWGTVFGCLSVAAGSLGVRQRSVESCGPHPLIALLAAASRPFATSASSLNDLIREVRRDPGTWSEMQILLRRYDDCVRAGDGLHYKRSSSSANIFLTNFRDKDQPLLQPQQLSPFILHSPAPSNPDLDSPVGNVPEF